MDENITAIAENKDLQNDIRRRTLDETITVQAMFCIVISIAFVVANMVFPEIAVSLSEVFEKSCFSETSDDFSEKILDFINSKPVSYD